MRPDRFDKHSRHRPADFMRLSSGVYQGALQVKEAERDLRGAMVSREAERQSL